MPTPVFPSPLLLFPSLPPPIYSPPNSLLLHCLHSERGRLSIFKEINALATVSAVHICVFVPFAWVQLLCMYYWAKKASFLISDGWNIVGKSKVTYPAWSVRFLHPIKPNLKTMEYMLGGREFNTIRWCQKVNKSWERLKYSQKFKAQLTKWLIPRLFAHILKISSE